MLRILLGIMSVVAACVAMQPAPASDILPPVPVLHAKWSAIQARMAADAARLVACRADPEACSTEDKRLEALVDAAHGREGRARIGEANRAINLAIRPANDLLRFGEPDRWSSPLETLQAGAGDCEDYAILKFLVLREAGFADDHLRILIVRDTATQQDHAVLAARLAESWLILDNRRFALVEMRHTRYRVLAQLVPGGTAPEIVRLARAADEAQDGPAQNGLM